MPRSEQAGVCGSASVNLVRLATAGCSNVTRVDSAHVGNLETCKPGNLKTWKRASHIAIRVLLFFFPFGANDMKVYVHIISWHEHVCRPAGSLTVQ